MGLPFERPVISSLAQFQEYVDNHQLTHRAEITIEAVRVGDVFDMADLVQGRETCAGVLSRGSLGCIGCFGWRIPLSRLARKLSKLLSLRRGITARATLRMGMTMWSKTSPGISGAAEIGFRGGATFCTSDFNPDPDDPPVAAAEPAEPTGDDASTSAAEPAELSVNNVSTTGAEPAEEPPASDDSTTAA